jgi:hypothetical protein
MAQVSYAVPRPPLPLGVAILAVLIGIVGFIFLIAGVLLITLGGTALGGLSVYGAGLLGGLILLFFGIVLLVVASGLWNRELWALALAILVLILALVSNLYAYFVGGGASVVALIVEILLLIYLIAVSHHFR